MAQPRTEECGTCQEIEKRTYPSQTIALSEDDVFQGPDDSRARRRSNAEKFLKCVNAFLNDGGGTVCLHVDNPYPLGTFEQSVDKKMASLIPDDSPFHENFERHIWGKNHVIYRVKPKSGMLSTFSFETKIPLDSGVEDPTHAQMRYLWKHKEDQSEDNMFKIRNLRFSHDQEVDVEESVFQEGKGIQAKRVMGFQTPGTFKTYLKSNFFDKSQMSTYLPKYISAFTKLAEGGSIFLGIKEDKQEIAAWEKVGETPDLTLHNSTLHLWKTSDGRLVIAKESELKEVSKSGKFICEGVEIDPQELNTLPGDIQELITRHISWCSDTEPTEFQSLAVQPEAGNVPQFVDVHFHPLLPTERVVIEIQVKPYKGMIFLDPAGPIGYRLPEHPEAGSLEPNEMRGKEWLGKFSEDFQKLSDTENCP